MKTVRQILESKPPRVYSVQAEASVLDAACVMNDHHIGAVVVTQGDKVVGIFTERDLLNRVVARRCEPSGVCVREAMTAPVAVCGPDTAAAECRQVMRSRRIRHLPVVEGERLIGMISIGDLLEIHEAAQQETIRYLYEYMYGEWKSGQ